MADDSIDVKLGASDEGLSEGLDKAASDTKASSDQMAAAFAQMGAQITQSLNVIAHQLDDFIAHTKVAAAGSREAAEESASGFAKMGEGLNAVKENLEGFADRISGIQKLMGLIGEVAMFGFIGEQVADVVKEFAEWGDSMEKVQAQTGLATEDIQKLQFAAQNSGVSTEELNAAMGRLSRAMSEAQGGNKQAQQAFAALGISMDQIKGKNLDQTLHTVADAFAAHADGANKSAVAMQLFGRAGNDLVAFLDKGGDNIDEFGGKLEALGAVMSDEDKEKAAELNEQLIALDKQMQVLKLRAGEELTPAFEAIVKAMSDDIAEGGAMQIVLAGLENVFIVITELIAICANTFGYFALSAMEDCALFEDVFTNWGRNVGKIIDEYESKIDEADTKTAKLISSLEAASPSLFKGAHEPQIEPAPDNSAPDLGKGDDGAKGWSDGKPQAGALGGQDDNTANAVRALMEAQNNAALALTKEHLSEETALYEDEYKNGLMSLQDYYAKRLETQRAGLEAERSTKEADLKSAQQDTATQRKSGKPSDVIEALAKEVALKGEIAVLDAKLADLGPENARAEADAQKKLNDELALTNIEKDQNVAKSNANTAKANAEAEYDAGMITKQQLTALEMQSTQEMYEIDRDALEKKAQLYQQDVQKYAQAQAQIAELDAQHQAQMAQLQAQATAEQMKDSKQATDDIEQDFSRAFASFADGTETARQAFGKFITLIEQQLTQLVSKDLFNKLFQMGGDDSISSTLTGWMSKLFGGSGGVGQATQDVATTANTTALTTLTTAVMQLATEIMAGGGSGGGLSALLSSVVGGGGDVAGDFGFTTSLTGSADAVAGGAVAEGSGGMSALMGLASFDVGSPYIPTDMVAQIHKGEAIIPAHLNSPYNPNNVAVTNNFVVPGGADLRTQSQIFAMAGAGIQNALRRNG